MTKNLIDTAVLRDLLNRYENRTQTRTVISAVRVHVREIADVLEPTRAILDFLDGMTRVEEPDCRRLLFRLAHQGVLLRDAIDGDTPRLATARRLQIVAAKPEAFLPVEFCYDGDAPDDGVDLCSGFYNDACTGCTKPRTPDLICPMAFWGLSKVIERHLYDPGIPYKTGWIIVAKDGLSGSRDLDVALDAIEAIIQGDDLGNRLVTEVMSHCGADVDPGDEFSVEDLVALLADHNAEFDRVGEELKTAKTALEEARAALRSIVRELWARHDTRRDLFLINWKANHQNAINKAKEAHNG